MGIAYVQSDIASASGVMSLSKAYPGVNTAGNFLICAVDVYNNSGIPPDSVSDSAGNTWTLQPGSSIPFAISHVEIWTAENCLGGANTVTLHLLGGGGSNNPSITILEYSGILTSSSFDQQNLTSGTGIFVSSGNIITSGVSDLVVGFSTNVDSPVVETPNAGWNTRQPGFYDMTNVGVSTYNFMSTLNTSVRWTGYTMAFKGTSVVPPSPGASSVVCIMG